MSERRPAQHRRSTEEVRRALLAAATAEFAAHGYRGASTRSVAASATVSESALYRHFASKAELFSAATVEPLARFLGEFNQGWTRRDGVTRDDDETLMLALVAQLYDGFRACRDQVRPMLAGSAGDTELAELTSSARSAYAGMVAQTLARAIGWQQRRGVHVPALDTRLRLLVALVMMLAVFDDVALGEPTLGRETVIRELAGMALRGVLTERPAP